jgi:diguanylate cyclase (GGDEF)-like protein
MNTPFLFDTRTIYALGAAVLWLSGLIVFLAIPAYPPDLRRVGRRWAAASAILGTAYGATAFTRGGSDPIPIIGGHLMTILATCTYFDAVTALGERGGFDWRSYLPVPLVFASAYYFSLVSPDRAHRVAVLSAVTAWQGLRNAYLLFRSRGEPKTFVRASAAAFGTWGLLLVARTGSALEGRFPISPFITTRFEQVFLSSSVIVCVFLSFSFLIIGGERLGASLRASEAQYRSSFEDAREQSIRDPLTNLYNRRYFDDVVPRDAAEAERSGKSLLLAVLDVDRFKEINDRWGHHAGDRLLLALTGVLSREVRKADLVCRIGGDEFLVVLRNTEPDEGTRLGERLCAAFAGCGVDVGDGAAVNGSLSIGLAHYHAGRETIDETLRRADGALYEAKRRGANRVVYS